jgi:uncharacterized protein YbaR (Trm112 family)
MHLNVLPRLRCPACRRGSLQVARALRHVQFRGTAGVRLWDGLLACQQCAAHFAVQDGIATLLRDAAVDPRGFEGSDESIETRDAPPVEQRLAQVAELVRPRCGGDAGDDFEYRVFHAEDRDKHVRALEGLVREPAEALLDIGGGQGGLLSAFGRRYHPRLSIMLDIDPLWVRVAAVRNPEVTVIRGDATNLPFHNGSLNLIVTTSTLEHVAEWRTMLCEVARVADQAYVSYGYNRFFPYEKGHIDAPFVTFLPKQLGQYVAFAWLKMIGKPRPLENIRDQLARTFFLSRGDATGVLSGAGMSTRSVFRAFLRESVRDEYHFFGGGLKRFLAKHDRTLAALSWLFDTTKSEPIVYLFASH